MTKLLEEAVAQIKQLSEAEQNAMATLILEELADDAQWDEAFASSPDLLARLALEAEQENQAGTTQKLDPNSL
jgi:hypothetical protein